MLMAVGERGKRTAGAIAAQQRFLAVVLDDVSGQ